MQILDPELRDRQSYQNAFGMMFWAFLFFIEFKLNLNGVSLELLPIFVGYILIFVASKHLLSLHPSARSIRTISGILIPFGLLEFIHISGPSVTVSSPSSSGIPWSIVTPLIPIAILGVLLSLLELVLKVMLVWKICGLVADLGEFLANDDMHRAALFRRGFYLFLIFAPFIAILFVFIAMPLGFMIFIALFIANIICICLLMGLMRQAQSSMDTGFPRY